MAEWVEVRLVEGALVVSGREPFTTLSSSLLGGGMQKKRHLANFQVPIDYQCDHASFDAEQRVKMLGLPVEETTAMMTAAYIDQVVERSVSGEQFQLRCFVTAGVSNAARAGVRRETFPGYRVGTINIIVVIDGRVTEAALVNAVISITEAKAAALQELGICDEDGRLATGTTTDAVIVAATQQEQYSGVHHFAGVATELGNALAGAVYESVLEAVEKYVKWQEQKAHGVAHES